MKIRKKLELNRETLRALAPETLEAAVAGQNVTAATNWAKSDCMSCIAGSCLASCGNTCYCA